MTNQGLRSALQDNLLSVLHIMDGKQAQVVFCILKIFRTAHSLIYFPQLNVHRSAPEWEQVVE